MSSRSVPHRLALLADVHGNLTALEAALADLAAFEVAGVLCLGDAANFGPQPRETLRRLRGLSPKCVLGNTDASLLTPRTLAEVKAPNEDTAAILAIEAWCTAQLEEADRDYLRSFQSSLRIDLGGLATVAYHGSPRNFDDQIRATTADEELDGYLAGEQAGLFLGAHTHEQFVRRWQSAVVANPGSVGQSFVRPGGGRVVSWPVAEYALLEVLRGQANLHFRRVPYDLAALQEAVAASGMPHQETWLRNHRPVGQA